MKWRHLRQTAQNLGFWPDVGKKKGANIEFAAKLVGSGTSLSLGMSQIDGNQVQCKRLIPPISRGPAPGCSRAPAPGCSRARSSPHALTCTHTCKIESSFRFGWMVVQAGGISVEEGATLMLTVTELSNNQPYSILCQDPISRATIRDCTIAGR